VTYEELPWTRKRALANAKHKALRSVVGTRAYKRWRRRGPGFPWMNDLALDRFIDMAELLTKAALAGREVAAYGRSLEKRVWTWVCQ
jgi:hypothetical protein